MKDFFKGVKKHIGRLDADQLREQYELVTDEVGFFDKLLETIDRGIIALDSSGSVRFANPAAKTLLGEDLDNALKTLPVVRGRFSKCETTISYPEAKHLEIQFIPMEKDTLIYIRDTTGERERTEAELRLGANEAITNLAAGVAHEIGNPLNAIALNIQMLERDPQDKESIAIIKSQVKRLDGIIRDFLGAVKPLKPNLKPGSAADPLKDCLSAMRGQLEERSIRVTLDIPAALPTVALDKDQLEQVYFNLIKNSLEAMSDGKELCIRLESDDRDVIIRFSDCGSGMTNEQLAHLFEPYRTNKANGTGLGLMITRRIVESHGGTISAESTLGEGSTFTIRLPRLEKRVRQLNG